MLLASCTYARHGSPLRWVGKRMQGKMMAGSTLTAREAGIAAAKFEAAAATAVGASFDFTPGSDGLPGIYASRALDRGVDPRALYAQVRADRLGASERGVVSRALIERPRATRFGRGTAAHLNVVVSQEAAPVAPAKVERSAKRSRKHRTSWSALGQQPRWSRRLATAGLVALLALPLSYFVTHAQETSLQSRYIVQVGDTVESVAAEFGVAPETIVAASNLQDTAYLTAGETIIIPGANETPEEAAWNASQSGATSPFVVGAHGVAEGETLANISYFYGLDPWALANFNGVSDIDYLDQGDLLRIPLVDVVSESDLSWNSSQSAAPATEAAPIWLSTEAQYAVGGAGASWQQPTSEPVFAAEVPAYQQAFSLSCEYAAAYIATAAFGNGVPESAFMDRIAPSDNPHWGYRGDITGPWGGTDDYGVYPEALAPTLNEYGFVADIFYGGDVASLTSRLDAGMPVVTWLGYFGHNAWQQYDAGSYLLAPGMHVVTVYGYDNGGVYLSNPGRGSYDYYDWATFLDRWAVMDGMAMGVTPMQ